MKQAYTAERVSPSEGGYVIHDEAGYEGMRRAYACDCPGYRITRQQWLAENS